MAWVETGWTLNAKQQRGKRSGRFSLIPADIASGHTKGYVARKTERYQRPSRVTFAKYQRPSRVTFAEYQRPSKVSFETYQGPSKVTFAGLPRESCGDAREIRAGYQKPAFVPLNLKSLTRSMPVLRSEAEKHGRKMYERAEIQNCLPKQQSNLLPDHFLQSIGTDQMMDKNNPNCVHLGVPLELEMPEFTSGGEHDHGHADEHKQEHKPEHKREHKHDPDEEDDNPLMGEPLLLPTKLEKHKQTADAPSRIADETFRNNQIVILKRLLLYAEMLGKQAAAEACASQLSQCCAKTLGLPWDPCLHGKQTGTGKSGSKTICPQPPMACIDTICPCANPCTEPYRPNYCEAKLLETEDECKDEGQEDICQPRFCKTACECRHQLPNDWSTMRDKDSNLANWLEPLQPLNAAEFRYLMAALGCAHCRRAIGRRCFIPIGVEVYHQECFTEKTGRMSLAEMNWHLNPPVEARNCLVHDEPCRKPCESDDKKRSCDIVQQAPMMDCYGTRVAGQDIPLNSTQAIYTTATEPGRNVVKEMTFAPAQFAGTSFEDYHAVSAPPKSSIQICQSKVMIPAEQNPALVASQVNEKDIRHVLPSTESISRDAFTLSGHLASGTYLRRAATSCDAFIHPRLVSQEPLAERAFDSMESLSRPLAERAFDSMEPLSRPLAERAFDSMEPLPRPLTGRAFDSTDPFPRPLTGRAFDSTDPLPRPLTGRAFDSTDPLPRPLTGRAFDSKRPLPRPLTGRSFDPYHDFNSTLFQVNWHLNPPVEARNCLVHDEPCRKPCESDDKKRSCDIVQLAPMMDCYDTSVAGQDKPLNSTQAIYTTATEPGRYMVKELTFAPAQFAGTSFEDYHAVSAAPKSSIQICQSKVMIPAEQNPALVASQVNEKDIRHVLPSTESISGDAFTLSGYPASGTYLRRAATSCDAFIHPRIVSQEPLAERAFDSMEPLPRPLTGRAFDSMEPLPRPLTGRAFDSMEPLPRPLTGRAFDSTDPLPRPLTGRAFDSKRPLPRPLTGRSFDLTDPLASRGSIQDRLSKSGVAPAIALSRRCVSGPTLYRKSNADDQGLSTDKRSTAEPILDEQSKAGFLSNRESSNSAPFLYRGSSAGPFAEKRIDESLEGGISREEVIMNQSFVGGVLDQQDTSTVHRRATIEQRPILFDAGSTQDRNTGNDTAETRTSRYSQLTMSFVDPETRQKVASVDPEHRQRMVLVNPEYRQRMTLVNPEYRQRMTPVNPECRQRMTLVDPEAGYQLPIFTEVAVPLDKQDAVDTGNRFSSAGENEAEPSKTRRKPDCKCQYDPANRFKSLKPDLPNAKPFVFEKGPQKCHDRSMKNAERAAASEKIAERTFRQNQISILTQMLLHAEKAAAHNRESCVNQMSAECSRVLGVQRDPCSPKAQRGALIATARATNELAPQAQMTCTDTIRQSTDPCYDPNICGLSKATTQNRKEQVGSRCLIPACQKYPNMIECRSQMPNNWSTQKEVVDETQHHALRERAGTREICNGRDGDAVFFENPDDAKDLRGYFGIGRLDMEIMLIEKLFQFRRATLKLAQCHASSFQNASAFFGQLKGFLDRVFAADKIIYVTITSQSFDEGPPNERKDWEEQEWNRLWKAQSKVVVDLFERKSTHQMPKTERRDELEWQKNKECQKVEHGCQDHWMTLGMLSEGKGCTTEEWIVPYFSTHLSTDHQHADRMLWTEQSEGEEASPPRSHLVMGLAEAKQLSNYWSIASYVT
ncbi:unnamed protein product [Cyprideis torosa]|uniref:Uncharacterized protein n=1 Tax=Cyprideis torosa TaxID=163714 RepID=A0A7R8ZFF7_9CRUS|nr:unnamed protein product [Cyprideis torosa]CAG0878965.1 unnamed protein product [Cyprideis torosa]